MDSRYLVTSIVKCYVPKAFGRAERQPFSRVCRTSVVEGKVQSKSGHFALTQSFRYLDIDRRSLYALCTTRDLIAPVLTDIDQNPISWFTFGITYGWHMPSDVIVVWSLHA